MASNGYDPSMLLDPRGKGTQGIRTARPDAQRPSSTQPFDTGEPTFSPPSAYQPSSQPLPASYGYELPHHQDIKQGFQFSNTLDKLHNVEQRQEPPAKRRKPAGTEDEEIPFPNKSRSQARGSNGGIIGDSLREHQKQSAEARAGQDKSVPIDLTDDDDVIIVKSHTEKEVCIGRIDGARVNAHRIPTPGKTAAYTSLQKMWPPLKINLQRRPGSNTHIIGATDAANKDFGTIDVRTAGVLAPLMDSAKSGVRFTSRLDPRKREAYEYPGQACSAHFGVQINIYCARRLANGIGKLFSQKNIFLSRPISSLPGIEYVNPHDPTDFTPASKKALLSTSRYGTAGSQVYRTQEEVRNDVYRIFDTIQQNDDIPEMDTPEKVKTSLLRHQKQALWFMTDREKDKRHDESNESSMWQKQDGSSWYHIMTGHTINEVPEPTLGGILADVMGLGKTLNVLSLIVSSLDEARKFAELKPPEHRFDGDPENLAFNSRATLLVCPLSTVANWEEQIKQHLIHGKKTLKYTVYHGSDRPDSAFDLQDYDMIITTYPIVAADAMRRSSKRLGKPLEEIHWFRIVLDEAHLIREPTTFQSKAVCALSAQRRWAVTGTPVQNRLEDLGALFKFLRVRPFEELRNFQQHIITPFKMADVEILPKLRLLVDSITLRRLKDKLDLPPRHELIHKLIMSDPERSFYDYFSRESQKGINQMLKQEKIAGKGYAHVLKAILRMRLMCAAGADLLSEEDWELARGFDATTAIDLEEPDNLGKTGRTPRQAFELYKMMKDTLNNSCVKCQAWITAREIQQDDSDESDGEEQETPNTPEVFGYLAGCNQLICPNCIDEFSKECADNSGPDNYGNCPICETYMHMKSFFELKQDDYDAEEAASRTLRSNPRMARQFGRYEGPHTKTRALLEQLQEDAEKTEALAAKDEPPIKSVVFSGWTSHLDLIQLALDNSHINYVRLDGSMSRKARARALESFSTDHEITCILISIAAGGLGLNLTAASRVFVMEPQYNPAAEAQAIERVHRLGQKREVTIVKYIMANSFEEKMLILQDKKKALAEMSLDKQSQKKFDSQEKARQKMEEIRTLFR